MRTSLLIFITLYSICSYSQLIDSNKNTFNEFYNGEVKSIELNGAKATVQFKLFNLKPSRYKYTNQEEITSAVKNNAFFLNLGVTNTTTFLNLNKFDFKENNGFTAGFTYQHAFSKIFLAKEPLKNNPHSLKSFFISLNYQQDKFNNYDPNVAKISKATPDKLLLTGGYSMFFFHYKDNAKFKYALLPSLHGKIGLITYNEDQLQNYLLTSNTTEESNITFTSSSSFDGKYGVIDNAIQTAKLAFSLPFVPEKPILSKYLKKRLPIISPIPYISYEYFNKGIRPRLNGGFALGFLSSSLVDKSTKKPEAGEGGGYFKAFNVPSFLQIGVDWNQQGDYSSKPNYFISGSIKLN